ncbi:MAG: hypothetical protein GX774_01840 [Armatimonadetes bacterium]|jgi:hypothetical protein|nr:hypothetical protein [Armatimonadota bacterium]
MALATQEREGLAEAPTLRVPNVRLGALLLGLALVPFNVYWVIVAELRWYLILTLNPLFVTPIFYLFALAGLNALLRQKAPRWVLNRAELLVIYVMLVMSCTVATHDFIINLMSSIPWPGWFASPENRWESTLFPHLPRWLLVWDKELLAGCFKGNANLYDPRVLRMWLAPLAFWSVFIFSVGWSMLCLNVLLRKAWMDQTRLSFPIIRLPLALTEEGAGRPTLRSRALWAGFALAAGLSVINGLHQWIPTLPHFPVCARWVNLPSWPWAAANPFSITLYPFAIGLAFLVPLDVSFSCWFFYLFMKLQYIVGFKLGYLGVPGFPYVTEQAIGAWYAFGFFLLYASRRYLGAIVRGVLTRKELGDGEEPFSYRVAFWGLLVGVAIFFGFWWAAGMNPVWVVVVLLTYFLLAICITRVRAEAGGQHTVWDLEPKNLFRLFDSQMIGPANLAVAAVSHWYWRLNRSHVMPSQMEAFKLAQEQRVPMRSLVMPMLVALVVATFVGMWACLHVFYHEGALTKCAGFAVWTGTESYDWLNQALDTGFKPERNRWIAVGSSAGFVVLLSWLRMRFARFPFHPLGYCIGPGLIWHWSPFFIAWLLKLVILRYGGLRFYRRALPFFLGLVLGDYVLGALWTLIGVWWNVPSYGMFH